MKALIFSMIAVLTSISIKASNITACIDHYPPFQMLSPKPSGENISAINLLAKILNRKVTYIEGYSFEYCIELLKVGQVDLLAGLNDSQQRREFAYLLPYQTKQANGFISIAGSRDDVISSAFVVNGQNILQSSSLSNLYFGISKKGKLTLTKTDIIRIEQAFQNGLFSDVILLFKKSHPNLYLN